MVKALSKNFEMAIEILGIEPTPKDIIKQLDELRKGVPEEELPLFDQLYDSLE